MTDQDAVERTDDPSHGAPDDGPAARHQQEIRGSAGQREGPGQRRGHRKAEADQPGGIVEQRFAFEYMHET